MENSTTPKYYNENGADVTRYIEEGKTTLLLFSEGKTRNDAKNTASDSKSYFYEVFEDVKDNTGTHRTHVGYGIPK